MPFHRIFSSKSLNEGDLQDLHGKVAIVTGSNTGIGYATVQFLARKGAKVYMAARDEGRALDAVERLKTEHIGDGTICWLKLDLSNPRIAKAAAEEFLQLEDRLDILVNNAARGAYGTCRLDEDGLLDIMVTNHISPFAFTEALLPLLKQTAKKDGSDVRIVNVTTMAHIRASPTSFVGKDALNKNYGDTIVGRLDTYAHTKLANILHIKELQRQLDSENVPITCMSLNPSATQTEGFDRFMRTLPWFVRILLGPLARLFFDTWRAGAMTSAFAAASEEVKRDRERYKGAFLMPIGKISRPSNAAMDERLAGELYQTTLEVLRELGI